MNEALKLAREQKKIATLNTVKDLMFNPVVEFVAGMYLIDTLYPDIKANGRGELVRDVVTVQGPLGIGAGLAITETDQSGYTTIANKSTKGDWARDTLKWIILIQQIGPYAPGIVQGLGSTVAGVAGALTKGAVK